ncbi:MULTISPECIES: response regulator transcription factor [Mesorhizobium]|nr:MULTISPECIES: response regulator transcription factor [Mesorhizobium]
MKPNSLAGMRILLLEDEPLIALEVEDLCRENGVQEVVTHSVFDEAEAAIAGQFDIAVVDLILRGKSALPLADRLKSAQIPIVFTTGGDAESQLAERFPDAPLVKKPYTGMELIDAIRSVRDRSGSI